MTNCTFSGNSANADNFGGGMRNWYSSPTVMNCTFSSNSAGEGGGISNESSSPTVTNCILWGDMPNEIAGEPADVSYSCVQGGYTGGGYILVHDPSFVDPLNGDLRLNSDSLCIDRGTSDGAPPADILGVARPEGAGFDMGAYEYDFPWPHTPLNPGATAIGINTIMWTWEDNSDNETGFKVYDDPGAGPPITLQMTTAADEESWPHAGLNANTQYAFQVYATNGDGDSLPTPNYTAWTLIEPASGLVFSNVGATLIGVASSNTPSNLASGASGLYFVNNVTLANSDWQQTNAAWLSQGLSPNVEYSFTGRSRNGVGVETAPVIASQWTLAATPVAPIVVLPDFHSLYVVIYAGDGNPAGTLYAIQISPAVGGNTWVQADGTVGANPVYQTAIGWFFVLVTGLDDGTVYEFRVIARNGAGVDTAPGPAGIGTTLEVADPLSITTQPESLTVVAGESATFTVLVSGGCEPISYQWRWDGSPIENENGSSYTIESAQEGNEGDYTVLVTDDCSAEILSDPPAILTVTVLEGVPVAGLIGLAAAALATGILGALRLRRRTK